MGKKGAVPPREEEWVIHYAGGGPLDGLVSVTRAPLTSHAVQLEDEGFEGQQVYTLSWTDKRERVIVLRYAGEHWGPPAATPDDESAQPPA
jgi:hypothetical protein